MNEERLQAYLDGRLDDEERRALEEELLASDELSEELVDELALRDLVEERRRRVAAPRRAGLRRLFVPTAIVIAAAAILLLWFRPAVEPPETLRGNGNTMTVSPVGELTAAPREFRWEPIDGAPRVRFELFDPGGTRVHSETVAGTSVAVENAPANGYWTLRALDETGIPGDRFGPYEYQTTP